MMRRVLCAAGLCGALLLITLAARSALGWELWRGVGERRYVGIAKAALFYYWDTPLAGQSAAELGAALRGFHRADVILWPARSSLGVIIPLWAPAMMLGVPSLVYFPWRIRQRKPS